MSETIGEFSATRVSWSLSKTVDGKFQQTSCYEGNAEGFGVVYGTLNITRPLSEAGDFSGGTCTYAGMGLSEDGSAVAGLGEGTWNRPGSEMRFNLSLMINVSDGSKVRSEGVIDYTQGTPTWTGTNYVA